MAVIGLAACSSATRGDSEHRIIERRENRQKTIAIGSKNFAEQYVLGEIYSQSLEAAGFEVERKLHLGDTIVAFKALRGGDVDAYPEYTGTILAELYDTDVAHIPKHPAEAFDRARRRLTKDRITALAYTPFQDAYTLGAARTTADRSGFTRTSDLQREAGELTITGSPECRERLDCYLGLQRAYRLRFRRYVDSETPYELLDQGAADVAILKTTDGKLARDDYQVFEDDKHFFPPYNASLLVRNEAAERMGPEARQLLERVQASLSNQRIIELNQRVEGGEKPEDVAREYLEEEGFVR